MAAIEKSILLRSAYQFPFAVDNLHHHPCPLVETDVVGSTHVDDALRYRQVLDGFDSVTQRGAEFLASRLAFFQGLRRGCAQQHASIPGVSAEGRNAAGAVGF